MYKTWHQRCISIGIIIGEKQYSLWCQPKKNKFSTQTTLDGIVVSLFLLWSLGPRWERYPNWVDQLDDPAETCGLIPCISCMWHWAQSARPSLQSNIFPSSYSCWANFDFSSKPCVRLYLCSLMHTSKGLLVSPMEHLSQSYGMLYTHCFVCRASLMSRGVYFLSWRSFCYWNGSRCTWISQKCS
jgi:hypothetical protein